MFKNKILISHRGNLNGESKNENNPDYIDSAINKNFNVEVDVWLVNNDLFLGHDNPQYKININWIKDRITYLWVHCKNVDSFLYFKEIGYPINFFWHQNDVLTLTSLGYIWVYPGNQPIKNSIAVLPEIYKDDITLSLGICSDHIFNYI